MQQPQPNTTAAPTFWELVIGTMLGQLSCLVTYLLFFACLFIAFGALLGPQIGNIFSRITSGLGAP